MEKTNMSNILNTYESKIVEKRFVLLAIQWFAFEPENVGKTFFLNCCQSKYKKQAKTNKPVSTKL